MTASLPSIAGLLLEYRTIAVKSDYDSQTNSRIQECVKTAELIQAVANDCGVQVRVVKETSPEAMLKHRVMSTPAVVVDNQLMRSGAIPGKKQIEMWLK